MAIRLLDLQLLYGVAGAREHFEDLCTDLIRAEYSDAKGVRCESSVGVWMYTSATGLTQKEFLSFKSSISSRV